MAANGEPLQFAAAAGAMSTGMTVRQQKFRGQPCAEIRRGRIEVDRGAQHASHRAKQQPAACRIQVTPAPVKCRCAMRRKLSTSGSSGIAAGQSANRPRSTVTA
jgi:hypothetical protein